MSIYTFTITRASTLPRLDMLKSTLTEGRKEAGMDFTWMVHTLSNEAFEVVNELKDNLNLGVVNHKYNVGQHVITNFSIKDAFNEGYDKLLRLDDDIKFKTKKWLFKLNEASDKLGPTFIISPKVMGLNHPPEASQVVSYNGVDMQILMDAIGGICRLHYLETLCSVDHPYISDIRQPLGFGDATGMGNWCKAAHEKGLKLWMAYVLGVNIKHAHTTAKQIEIDPIYHEQHNLFQVIPYIPPYLES